MPLFFKRVPGTSINIDSDVPRTFGSTFTSARKFSAPDLSNEQEVRGTQSRANDDILISQAAAMKGVAAAAESVAAEARSALDSVRARLDSVSGVTNQDVRPVLPNVTEFDVSSAAEVEASRLALAIKPGLAVLNTQLLAQDIFRQLPSLIFRARVDTPAPVAFNPVVPLFDGVSVEMDKNRGAVDCFFANLRFSLPLSQVANGRTRAVRIFRSTVLHPFYQRGTPPVITVRGLERLSTLKMRARSKSNDQLGAIEQRYREAGVLTALSVLSPFDPETGLRVSTDLAGSSVKTVENSSFSAAIVPGAREEVASFLDPARFGSIDRSVGTDPLVLRNIRSQDASAGVPDIPRPFVLNLFGGRRSGLLNRSQVDSLRADLASQIVVEENNGGEFRELAFFSLDKLRSSVLGDHVEYQHVDETVGFGRAYRYYIVSVDQDMVESVRSEIVDVTIEGIRVPERPKRVFSYVVQDGLAFNLIVDDQLVEKFEVFRREADLTLVKQERRFSRDVSDVRGFNTNLSIVEPGENSFVKLGECLNGSKGTGATYHDREVVPGRKYLYRFYSVDLFGNKSESPYEVSIFFPEPSSRPNELVKPNLTAEVDALTGKSRLTFKCTDGRVRRLFLARRDLTLGQKAFTTPGQVNQIRLGSPKAGEGALHFEGPLLRGENKDISWTGFFDNSQDDVTYIDHTVSVDHVYQYRIHGVDLYGNATPFEYSRPFMVVRRPMVSAPVNLVATVVQGPEFTVGGVRLDWQNGNVDVASEDRLGNRDDLAASAVRTLYQVERRKVGEERWAEFPLVEGLQFFDPSPSVLGDQNPGFRPQPVELNQTYVYRVKSLQTGSYVSNYSNFVEVFAALPVRAPANFRVRSADPKVKPFYTVLNWDTPNDSGIVDKWEVDRAEVNNFAASRLNVRNPVDFQTLDFRRFREVFREASRFRSQGVDNSARTAEALTLASNQPSSVGGQPTAFTGQHQFQDSDVRFGNTYFYRIRSVGVDGSRSSWVYRGMKLTDQTVERLIDSVVPAAVKKELSSSPVPLVIPQFDSLPVRTSFALQPQFSKPNPIPTVQVSPPAPVVVPATPTPLPTFIPPAETAKPVLSSATVVNAIRSSLLQKPLNTFSLKKL